MGSVNQFLYGILYLFLGTFCSSVSTYLLSLFSFIISQLFRRRNYSEVNFEEKDSKFINSENGDFGKKVTDEFCFKFKFPGYEEFRKSNGEERDSVSTEEPPISVANGEDKDSMQVNSETEAFHPEITENSGFKEAVSEKIETMIFTEDNEDFDKNVLGDQCVSAEIQFDSEKNTSIMDSDSESISSSDKNGPIHDYSDGFLLDKDFEIDDNNEMSETEDTVSDEEEDSDIMKDFLSEKDFQEDLREPKNEESIDGLLDNCDHDSNKMETQWEHQELIEQLKMELKKVRATGLPTILEETESPKLMEDLKPWKIDEKFRNEYRMDEPHNFYKSYRERMRKFDILNYQKMYAIGFLQLKNPLQSIPSQISSSSPPMTSLFSENLFIRKSKKTETDPMVKFIKELQRDLEMVYVGQMCLSWEILHWQYGKALEQWESDPRGICSYNEVGCEFQQFQVLIQRFIEDEPFQGPRVLNYVKSRCVLRNLLQVPPIREDSSKDRKNARRRENGEYGITSNTLVETMEESIRTFWSLLRADKNCANLTVKSQRRSTLELQDPANFELLMEVRASFQKKEKKLKDMLRSGKCILKRFKRCQEDNSDQVLYFFSQVDLKLVSRVLNMSRITKEQLVWCRNKLSKISFVNKKIQVEPSFLLFPC